MAKTKTQNKKAKGIVRTIILAIVGIILGINIYMFNAQTIVGDSLPMPFGYGVAVVLSGSMEPAFYKDDVIFVEQTDEYAIGDVIVFQDRNILVTHRIIDIDGDMVQTKGDANNSADIPIDRSSVKGKVIASLPYVGMLINILKTPVGTVTILIAAFLLLESSYRKEKDQDEDELEKIRAEIKKIKESFEENEQ